MQYDFSANTPLQLHTQAVTIGFGFLMFAGTFCDMQGYLACRTLLLFSHARGRGWGRLCRRHWRHQTQYIALLPRRTGLDFDSIVGWYEMRGFAFVSLLLFLQILALIFWHYCCAFQTGVFLFLGTFGSCAPRIQRFHSLHHNVCCFAAPISLIWNIGEMQSQNLQTFICFFSEAIFGTAVAIHSLIGDAIGEWSQFISVNCLVQTFSNSLLHASFGILAVSDLNFLYSFISMMLSLRTSA